MLKRSISTLVVAAAAVAAVAVGPAVAAADTPTTTLACPDGAGSRAAVTSLANRPDGGNHDAPGVPWALDNLTRTVTVTCVARMPVDRAAAAADGPQLWRYHAVLADAGTFVTNGAPARSPQAGSTLRAGVKGTVTGGFSVDFVAAARFVTYHNLYGGHSYSGSAPTSTSAWVGTLFSDYGKQPSIGENWSWTYVTNCRDNGLVGAYGERWVDANPSAGASPADGDITGAFLRRCCKPSPPASPSGSPSSSPSSSPSVSPSGTTSASAPASASPSESTQGVVLTGNGPSGSLPVTGTPLTWIAGAAVVLLAGGSLVLILTRRRRAAR